MGVVFTVRAWGTQCRITPISSMVALPDAEEDMSTLLSASSVWKCMAEVGPGLMELPMALPEDPGMPRSHGGLLPTLFRTGS